MAKAKAANTCIAMFNSAFYGHYQDRTRIKDVSKSGGIYPVCQPILIAHEYKEVLHFQCCWK